MDVLLRVASTIAGSSPSATPGSSVLPASSAKQQQHVISVTNLKRRRRTSPQEALILESEFVKNPLPTHQERNLLAAKVGMSERAAQVWFQNRRQKEKKDSNQLALDPASSNFYYQSSTSPRPSSSPALFTTASSSASSSSAASLATPSIAYPSALSMATRSTSSPFSLASSEDLYRPINYHPLPTPTPSFSASAVASSSLIGAIAASNVISSATATCRASSHAKNPAVFLDSSSSSPRSNTSRSKVLGGKRRQMERKASTAVAVGIQVAPVARTPSLSHAFDFPPSPARTVEMVSLHAIARGVTVQNSGANGNGILGRSILTPKDSNRLHTAVIAAAETSKAQRRSASGFSLMITTNENGRARVDDQPPPTPSLSSCRSSSSSSEALLTSEANLNSSEKAASHQLEKEDQRMMWTHMLSDFSPPPSSPPAPLPSHTFASSSASSERVSYRASGRLNGHRLAAYHDRNSSSPPRPQQHHYRHQQQRQQQSQEDEDAFSDISTVYSSSPPHASSASTAVLPRRSQLPSLLLPSPPLPASRTLRRTPSLAAAATASSLKRARACGSFSLLEGGADGQRSGRGERAGGDETCALRELERKRARMEEDVTVSVVVVLGGAGSEKERTAAVKRKKMSSKSVGPLVGAAISTTFSAASLVAATASAADVAAGGSKGTTSFGINFGEKSTKMDRSDIRSDRLTVKLPKTRMRVDQNDTIAMVAAAKMKELEELERERECAELLLGLGGLF